MIPKALDLLSNDDIYALMTNQVKEGRGIEYKETLPGGKDADRKEFLGDVSSFGNAAGGDLLFGVVEKREGGKTTGLPETIPGLGGINADQEIRRLDSMIQSGIAPRISGIRIRQVDGFAAGPVILVRIPRGYSAPYMVTFQESSRFYSRNNAGKYLLDVSEIRSAFALSESLPERIRRFRDERLGRIVAGETCVPNSGPKVVLHLLPLTALDSTTQVDVELMGKQAKNLQPMYSSGWDFRYNIDGFLCHNTRGNPKVCRSYVQIFRSGAIESVDAGILVGRNDEDRLFPAPAVERELIDGIRSYLAAYSDIGVGTPIVLMVTLVGVKDYYILGPEYDDQERFDRDTLFLPDILVETFGIDVGKILRPLFDAMWQASGWPRCHDYDRDGNWVPRR